MAAFEDVLASAERLTPRTIAGVLLLGWAGPTGEARQHDLLSSNLGRPATAVELMVWRARLRQLVGGGS